jgi:hypothetical protein
MSKGVHEAFVSVIIILRFDWKPKHVTLGLFDATKTTWHALTKKKN